MRLSIAAVFVMRLSIAVPGPQEEATKSSLKTDDRGALDTVTFASTSSAAAHNVAAVNGSTLRYADAPADNNLALAFGTRETGGGAGQGRVLFDMACSPTGMTHLTVKFWGGAAMINGSKYGHQMNTWLLDPAKNYSAQWGWGHAWPCELDQTNPDRSEALDGPFPGRWQFVTYVLPERWTHGKSTVRLGIGTGIFQWYGGGTLYPSRALFRAYTHAAPYLSIPAGELHGSEPPHADARALRRDAVATLTANVTTAVARLFAAQAWNWSDVEAGRLPACLFGAPALSGAFTCTMLNDSCPSHPYYTPTKPKCRNNACVGCHANLTACKDKWQGYDDQGNMPWTAGVAILAAAYSSQAAWAAQWRGKQWVVDRIVGALDVHVRAQGSNGGWSTCAFVDDRYFVCKWIGGPHRQPANDHLEGWPEGALSRSFIAIHANAAQRKLLDVRIGHDDGENPTRCPRRVHTAQCTRQVVMSTRENP